LPKRDRGREGKTFRKRRGEKGEGEAGGMRDRFCTDGKKRGEPGKN